MVGVLAVDRKCESPVGGAGTTARLHAVALTVPRPPMRPGRAPSQGAAHVVDSPLPARLAMFCKHVRRRLADSSRSPPCMNQRRPIQISYATQGWKGACHRAESAPQRSVVLLRVHMTSLSHVRARHLWRSRSLRAPPSTRDGSCLLKQTMVLVLGAHCRRLHIRWRRSLDGVPSAMPQVPESSLHSGRLPAHTECRLPRLASVWNGSIRAS